MKLLSIEPSRVTVLIHASRIEGQLYTPAALDSLVNAYRFVKYPEKPTGAGPNKITLEHGLFEEIAIDSVDIFNDGIIATSRSNTNITENFVKSALKFMEENWGVTFIKSHSLDRMYQSAVIFQSDKNILGPLDVYQKAAKQVEGKLNEAVGICPAYQPFGFSFSSDQAKLTGLKPGVFKIERRINTEYEFNQYFSFAPLRTDDHLEILENIEKSF